MSDLIPKPPMDQYEAKALIDTIKRDIGHVRRNLITFYERRGYQALGYGSMAECLRWELDVSQSRAYQLFNHERVLAEIKAHSTIVESAETEAHSTILESPLPASEAITRELAQDDDPAEAWADVVEINGSKPTAKQTRAVVQERRELMNPATDKQLSYLRSLADRAGAAVPAEPVSKARASKLIDHLRDGHACECKTCGRRMTDTNN